MNLDYKKLYEKLYKMGYQNEKNIGVKHVQFLVKNYTFNSILDIGKITELPILEVLTYLAYTQDYNNKEKNNYDKF